MNQFRDEVQVIHCRCDTILDRHLEDDSRLEGSKVWSEARGMDAIIAGEDKNIFEP